MRKILLVSLFLFLFIPVHGEDLEVDTTQCLEEIVVTSLYKGSIFQKLQPIPTATLSMQRIEEERIENVKDLSAIIPNYYIPEYGSKMTSSMYVRGMGARIDNPIMGLYVDGVPYFNKNNFDFDFCDIRSITVLRGPQSTLFGRNTMGGVIDITTLSPFSFQGTRLKAEYGNGNTLRLQASTYAVTNDSLGISASIYYKHSDGYYTNNYDGSDCDWSNSAGLRLRLQKTLSETTSFDNALSVSWLKQGGYPYRYLDSLENLSAVNYNDECGYRRLNINDGLSVQWLLGDFSLTNVAAYQYTDDCMQLDQDFLPKSMFTMKQAQREHLVSDELILKLRQTSTWTPLSGIMLFGRHIKMNAPVNFKADGINELILSNANKGIQTAFPNDEIKFAEDHFTITDDFRTETAGVAIYHNSTYRTGNFQLEGGIRLDAEKSWFNYDCSSLVNYRFTYNMPVFEELETLIKGKQSQQYMELLPRLSIAYLFGSSRIYASLSKGYKSGGFNTQLFSDILQNGMMNNMMQDIGVQMLNPTSNYTVSEVIEYKPEYSWNYEVGINYAKPNFTADAVLFFINCRDQQLTVFPEGQSTGRMMTNAGRTRNFGAELSMSYWCNQWRFTANYGYTNATFRNYRSGGEDYRGKYVPYVPQHTVALGSEYAFLFSGKLLDKLTLGVSWRGIGPIYWDEQNSVKQKFYGTFDASIRLQKQKFSCTIWGKNLTDTSYNVFYFVSMGNRFLQRGKPLQFGISFNYEI